MEPCDGKGAKKQEGSACGVILRGGLTANIKKRASDSQITNSS